jgi:hypothetical protein
MSTESIEYMGLLWRCKWLQMAEGGKVAISPVQRGNISDDVLC